MDLDEQQARQLVFMAFKWFNTGLDRWHTEWRQKHNDHRLEPSKAKLEQTDGGLDLVITDGLRATRVPIPNTTKSLFELILTVPFNRAAVVLDRHDPIVAELATRYLKKAKSP